MSTFNALTVDLEEYFHATNLKQAIDRASWHSQPSRIQDATKRLLELFDSQGSRATFFVLGWVAERHPDLVREIAARGHEIACHGYAHELIYEIGPERFRADVRRARAVVEDAALLPVQGFRAPDYSITRRSLWALEILWEEGFRFDSSIFPIRHHRYGIPDFPRRPLRIDFAHGGSIQEFPMTTVQAGPVSVPLGGGAYLRFLPIQLFRRGMEQLVEAREPTVLSVHPWEIDSEQPTQPVGWRVRTNHYHNLDRVESRLRDLLGRFHFAPMGEVLRELERAGRLPALALEAESGRAREATPDRAPRPSPAIERLPAAARPQTAPGRAAVASLGSRLAVVPPPEDGEEAVALEPPARERAEADRVPASIASVRQEPLEVASEPSREERPPVHPLDAPSERPVPREPGYNAASANPGGALPADAAGGPARAFAVPTSPLEQFFGGFQLADALELLGRRRWWLVLGAVWGLLAGILLWRVLPPSYEATTEILVEPQGVPESYIRSTITVSVEDRVDTLSQRVASFTSLSELIRRIGVERFDPSGRRDREAVMEGIRDGLRVEIPTRRREGAAIIELGYTASDPELALDVVHEVSNLFISENRKDRAQQARATAEFLDEELIRLREEVTQQEERIRAFRMAHLGALPSQLDANLRELDRLDVALAANLQAQETLLQQIELRGTRGQGGASGTDLDAALRQAALDLIEARKVYTEKHPKVQVLRKQIESLQRQLDGEPAPSDVASPPDPTLQREIDQATIALHSRRLEETQLRARRAELQERVETTPTNEQELAALTRDYENLVDTYERVLEDKHDATLAREMEEAQMAERFRVLRPPHVPESPTWPDPLLLLPGGLGVGLALALLLAVVAELRRPAFHSVHRVTKVAGIPLFASIPVLNRKRIYPDPKAELPDAVDWRVVVHHAPQSAAAEQYRGFLPHYLAAGSPRVVLVTSATPGDGKSVTSTNLAFSLATDLGRRVLLIDADLRRGRIHRLVGVGRGPGLASAIRGDVSLARCVVSPLPTLSVLPAGPPVENPLSLLSSEAFAKLRKRACEEYEVVVIDSPPVMPVIDGRLLHRVADMVVFVVRAGSTPAAGLIRSLQEMPGVAGIIFNRLSPESFRRYYQYDAYSYYAYPAPPEEPEPGDPRKLRGGRKAEDRRSRRG